jgi:hypothetical protein
LGFVCPDKRSFFTQPRQPDIAAYIPQRFRLENPIFLLEHTFAAFCWVVCLRFVSHEENSIKRNLKGGVGRDWISRTIEPTNAYVFWF